MRPMPVAGADALPADDVIEAWDYDGVRTLAGEQAVAIVGSGLSMADTVLALVAAGHSGPLHLRPGHVAADEPAPAPARIAPVCRAGTGRRHAVAGRDGPHPPARAGTVVQP
ncbi:hypothetical protein G6F68_016814 [Rhizopus microsporus]|nr:hypothetical protein G6F68_016814 [Rhizopus microsporus]